MTIKDLNTDPYKYLTRTSFFKEEVKDYKFISIVHIENEGILQELGAISKGTILEKEYLKIDSYNSNIPTFSYDFERGKDFKENYNEFFKNIKKQYPKGTIVFDVVENKETAQNFLKYAAINIKDIPFRKLESNKENNEVQNDISFKDIAFDKLETNKETLQKIADFEQYKSNFQKECSLKSLEELILLKQNLFTSTDYEYTVNEREKEQWIIITKEILEKSNAKREIERKEELEKQVQKQKIEKPLILDLFSSAQVDIDQPVERIQKPQEEKILNKIDFILNQDHQSFNVKNKFQDNINALNTLIHLLKSESPASGPEKHILSKYVGFGGLKEISFDPQNSQQWNNTTAQYKSYVEQIIKQTQEIDQLLGKNNTLSELRSGITNAHYTSSEIIKAMYKGIELIGFKQGKILEPSGGIGNFIGYMPEQMRNNSTIEAVEIDSITSNIAKLIYDEHTHQNKPYQEALILEESKDLIVSNVPFGDIGVYDKNFKNRPYLTSKIHNYFFAKALEQAKDGAIIAMVTSKGLLDSKSNSPIREHINSEADFLGAIRLNNESFKNSSGTQVVADILFLRKNNKKHDNPNFLEIEELQVQSKQGVFENITINKYFADNPQNIMGTLVSAAGLYNNKEFTVENDNSKTLEQAILNTLSPHKDTYIQIKTPERFIDFELLEKTKEGNLVIREKDIFRKEGMLFQEVNLPKYIDIGNVKSYIKLRDKTIELIKSEYNNLDDQELEEKRKELNTLYDQSGLSNKANEKLSKQWNRIVVEDSDGFTVQALTKEDGNKADILLKKTIAPNIIPNKVESIEDAIVISLNKHAKIEIETIKDLLSKDEQQIIELSKGQLFKDPKGAFYTKEEYLSGNVKSKLEEAINAFDRGDTSMQYNIDALEKIQPKDIPIHEIEVRMGSRWIPIEYYQDYGKFLFNDKSFELIYQKTVDSYVVTNQSFTLEAKKKYGTPRRSANKIIIDALHIVPPKVEYTDPITGQRLVDYEATKEAMQKYDDMRETFTSWIYKSQDRRKKLEEIFNKKFNTTVKPSFDGSMLKMPGLSGITLRPHQKDAIWRLLTQNGGIIDHKVGAGKTLVMISAAMEFKRTGVANKPIITALKSTIPEIYKTFKEAYPLAKVLSPTDKEFQKGNRAAFLSKIAMNDWDCIVLSHEQLAAIPHEPEFELEMLNEEKFAIESERGLIENKNEAKNFETRIKSIEKRVKELMDIRKDNMVFFQHTGIDHIFVDESQQFKNLSYTTKQTSVAGLSKPQGSKRAFNLLMAIRTLQDKYGADKGVTFSSGTILSNSVVEMYSVLKYLRPDKLRELGLETFDQWASTFTAPSNEIEFSVTGQFKSKSRFREFMNLPELSILYNEIADVRNDSNLSLDKPRMKTGDYKAEILTMSPEQKDYAERLITFAKTQDPSVLGKTYSEKQLKAYMLIVTNLAAKMSIDMRLIDKSYTYDPNGKIGKTAENVAIIYHQTKDIKATQLIFSDIGTPKTGNAFGSILLDYMQDELGIDPDTLGSIFGDYEKDEFKHRRKVSIVKNIEKFLEFNQEEIDDIIEQAYQNKDNFNVYEETKLRLIERGVKEEEIEFIHNFNTKNKKLELFKKVNNGEIRVLLGSTQKLGTGVNVQSKLAAIHHLDAPWRPSDMEQRNGRGLRQGNLLAKQHLNNEIDIIVYATENTLDTYKYQLLQTKMTFITQVSSGSLTERIIKEGSLDGAESFAIIMAKLSGNNTILEKFKLRAELEKLTRAEKSFNGMLYDAESKIKEFTSSIEQIKINLEKAKGDTEIFRSNTEFIVEKTGKKDEEIFQKRLKINTINGAPIIFEDDQIPTSKDYAKAMLEIINKKLTDQSGEDIKLFEFNNLTVVGKKYNDTRLDVATFKQYIVESINLSLLGKSGNKYTLPYSSIPGVFINQLTSRFRELPEIPIKQNRVLYDKIQDLESYQNISKEKEFPKKQQIEDIKLKIKNIDDQLEDKKEEENTEKQQQGSKIIIDNISYPLHIKEIQISVVQGYNATKDKQMYLAAVNLEMDYNKQWKMMIEPMFESLNGQWNKQHKSIIFEQKEELIEFLEYMKEEFNLENNINDLDQDTEMGMVQEPKNKLYIHKANDEPYLAMENQSYYQNSEDQITVKNLLRESNHVDFYSNKTKIQSPEDVYQIMKSLENKSVEHAYVIHVDQEQNPTIQFLGIGSTTGTIMDDKIILKGATEFNSVKSYLVHNHPSGTLVPSEPDKFLQKKITKMLEFLNVECDHIIVNSYKNAYTVLKYDTQKNAFDIEHFYNKEIGNEKREDYTKISSYVFDEVKFIKEPLTSIKSSKDAFNYIQTLRFSALPKIGLLVLSNSNDVLANFVLPKVETKDILNKINSTGIGTSCILYGNQSTPAFEQILGNIREEFNVLNIKLLDVVQVSSENSVVENYYRSFADTNMLNMLNETLKTYNTGDTMFENKMTITAKTKWDKKKEYHEIKEEKQQKKIERIKEKKQNNQDNNVENINSTKRGNRL